MTEPEFPNRLWKFYLAARYAPPREHLTDEDSAITARVMSHTALRNPRHFHAPRANMRVAEERDAGIMLGLCRESAKGIKPAMQKVSMWITFASEPPARASVYIGKSS